MIIVTGGAGFIGSALVWALNGKGITDIIIVDHLGENDKYKNIIPLKFLDVFDRDDFGHMVHDGFLKNNKVSVFYHLGACSSTTQLDMNFLLRNNYEYTKFMCNHCVDNDVRFVYASSAATYGAGENGYRDDVNELHKLKPLNPYGYSKQLFDLWASREGLLDRIAGMKYFNVFGPNEYHKGDMRSIVHKCFGQIKETGKAKLFKSDSKEYKDGDQKRDFVYVKDAVDMTIFLGENKNVNGLFNAGTGKATTFNEFIRPVFAALGVKENIEYFDMPGVLKGRYQDFTQADMTKLRNAGYKGVPTPIENAVKDYVGNYLTKDFPYLQ
ncbi:MAG TPA: ADP-glyceromanno-heptose 6-epimerase [Ignavibacteria bacterium]|nr:ADP-glyceromanno-heptose 6-epimerase [Ignavibacteria bacterium]